MNSYCHIFHIDAISFCFAPVNAIGSGKYFICKCAATAQFVNSNALRPVRHSCCDISWMQHKSSIPVFHQVNSNTNQPCFPLSASAHSMPASCFNNRALGWLEFERPQWHNDHFRTKWQQWMMNGILQKKTLCHGHSFFLLEGGIANCLITMSLFADSCFECRPFTVHINTLTPPEHLKLRLPGNKQIAEIKMGLVCSSKSWIIYNILY